MKTIEKIYKENGFTDDMMLPSHLVKMLMGKFAKVKYEELQADIQNHLNEHCVNPDDTGITQAEHFQEILEMVAIKFIDEKQGWQIVK